jgi:hypothetical protein
LGGANVSSGGSGNMFAQDAALASNAIAVPEPSRSFDAEGYGINRASFFEISYTVVAEG